MLDFSVVPFTYLLPVIHNNQIMFTCAEGNRGTYSLPSHKLNYAIRELKHTVSAGDDEVTWAGTTALGPLQLFSERYSPETHRKTNGIALEYDIIISIMGLPALCGALLQWKNMLPGLIASGSRIKTVLAQEAAAILDELRCVAPLMRLPKTGLECVFHPVKGSEDDYTFDIRTTYSGATITLFSSADGCIARDELLEGFSLTHRFCGTLPAFLTYLDDDADPATLQRLLRDFDAGFNEAGFHYA